MLRGLEDRIHLGQAAEGEYLVQRTALRVHNAYFQFQTKNFLDLSLADQRGLVSWLVKKVVYNQKAVAPFLKTSSETMQSKFPWYPANLEWKSPAHMPVAELSQLFECLLTALGDQLAARIREFEREAPLGGIAANTPALLVLKAKLTGASAPDSEPAAGSSCLTYLFACFPT